MLPAEWAGEVDDLACREGRTEAAASLPVDQLPARVADRCVRAQEVVHLGAPFRLPIPSEPAASSWLADSPSAPLSASASSPCSTMSPGWNSTPFSDLAPARGPAKQELEVHAEVLELLALRVAHDRQLPLDRSRLRGAAHTTRSPRPLPSATRTNGRMSASRQTAPRVARGTGRIPSDLLQVAPRAGRCERRDRLPRANGRSWRARGEDGPIDRRDGWGSGRLQPSEHDVAGAGKRSFAAPQGHACARRRPGDGRDQAAAAADPDQHPHACGRCRPGPDTDGDDEVAMAPGGGDGRNPRCRALGRRSRDWRHGLHRAPGGSGGQ